MAAASPDGGRPVEDAGAVAAAAALIDGSRIRSGWSSARIRPCRPRRAPDVILVEESGVTWAEVGETARAISVLMSESAGGRLVEVPRPRECGRRAELLAPRIGHLRLDAGETIARLAAERRSMPRSDRPAIPTSRTDAVRLRRPSPGAPASGRGPAACGSATSSDAIVPPPFATGRCSPARLRVALLSRPGRATAGGTRFVRPVVAPSIRSQRSCRRC
jgi:hypothetical protein